MSKFGGKKEKTGAVKILEGGSWHLLFGITAQRLKQFHTGRAEIYQVKTVK
ncbi:MAG: hypothetical protein LBN98_02305 [Prevotellaceae bacterium]|jgi:hypothetical protein|nr:hypothetical protein [Prevotellaceae bacterium]